MEKEEYVHSTQAGHMKIIAIHVGSVETRHYQDKKVLTAAHKHPVELCGFSGFYLRVPDPGPVQLGDEIILCAQNPAAVSIQFANRVMYRQMPEPESLERILAVPALSQAWRETLSKKRSTIQADRK